MKILQALNHTKIIVESEDDLFPGLDASVLSSRSEEEKSAQQYDLDWLKAQQERLSRMWNINQDQIIKQQAYFEENDAFIYIKDVPPGMQTVKYEDFDWLKKYPMAEEYLENSVISKASPMLKDIEKYVRAFSHYLERTEAVYQKMHHIRMKLRAVEKREKKKRTDTAQGTFDAYAKTVQQISPPKTIPAKLPVKNRKDIKNPYTVANARNPYAGHVAHYPHWSKYWKDQIVQIEEILKRNGKGGLGMMYAATHDNGGARFNFVITGANGNLTWRKYDPSPGAGQNWIYLNGKKTNTSSLLSASKAKQDQLVQSL